jgi:hypothetical protein
MSRVIKKEKNEMSEECGSIWKSRVVYRDLVGKPEEKRPFVTPRHGREDDIKMVANCDDFT